MVDAANPRLIYSRRKAISTYLLCMIQRTPSQQHGVIDTFVQVARASQQPGFVWHLIEPHFTTMLKEDSPISLKQTGLQLLPHSLWWDSATNIQLWSLAVLEFPYVDRICQGVVDTLLQIASDHTLRPLIPTKTWQWLGKLHPAANPLPPICIGRYEGSTWLVVQTVRALEDIGTLKSYLTLVWSEWDHLYIEGHREMCASIREDFGGNKREYDRRDLEVRLDYILGRLNLGLDHLQKDKPTLRRIDIWWMRKQYQELKEVLLEVGNWQTS